MSNNVVTILLQCEGMGDCLASIPVFRKLRRQHPSITTLVLFTRQPALFSRCPYIDIVFSVEDAEARARYGQPYVWFDTASLPYHLMDTIDFISIPAGLGQLTFREKQLEYFPAEENKAGRYDVVLNTSITWPSRSWSQENWQRLADAIVAEGNTVAVVGKDVRSSTDNITKTSRGLRGCIDLTNQLSLDQTYFTIANAGLFVTCQNGLSVLSGATDTEVILLDRSIDWSRYALYRHEDPRYRFSIVKGDCDKYCALSDACSEYGEFRCIPDFDRVWASVQEKLRVRAISNSVC